MSKSASDSKPSRVRLTKTLVDKLKPKAKQYAVADSDVIGLVVRVMPTGVKSYALRCRLDNGKRVCYSLGLASGLTVDQARDAARMKVGEMRKGVNPNETKRRQKAEESAQAMTLQAFLDGEYGRWAKANRKDGARNVPRLKSAFKSLLAKPLRDIAPRDVEDWRTARIRAVANKATEAEKQAAKDKKEAQDADALAAAARAEAKAREKESRARAAGGREIALLKACLSRAVQLGHIQDNPLKGPRGVKLAKVDRKSSIRAISYVEERRLIDALVAREAEHRAHRESHNEHLQDRHKPEMPQFGEFTDFLRPYVTLLLHTGLRRNEGFQLRWADVDLEAATLKVRAGVAKSGRVRSIPLNRKALEVLRSWRNQSGATGADELVFPSPQTGEALTHINTSWRHVTQKAGLHGLRLHDLRHTFATRALAAPGADIAQVQKLLGHANITTTAIYLHADEEGMRRTVEALAEHKPPENVIPFSAVGGGGHRVDN